MSTDVQALLERDRKGTARAASEYVRAMDPFEIPKYFQAAALTALQRGDGAAASVIRAVISGPDSYGDHLRWYASNLFISEPHVLAYFPEEFTRAVAGRVNLTPA
jgi:hypothetical protein